MSAWEKLAESRIQESIAAGEFTAPAGAPALDLAEYFALPASERVGISLLRNAGVVPPEVELLRRIARLDEEVGRADATHASSLREELQTLQVSFRLAIERRARSSRDA